MVQRRADWTFAAEPQAVPGARRRVAARLDALPDDSRETVLLLTTELLTNAVRHASGPITLRMTWGDDGVRVEVHDHSFERPVLKRPDRDAIGGRGLLLVEALAGQWGVTPNGSGKSVWFSLDA